MADSKENTPERQDRAPASPPPYWGWAVAAGVIALVLAALILAIVWLFGRTLALLALGVAIAAALAPLVNWLERGMPRLAAILLVYLALAGIFIGIFLVIIPPVSGQIQDLVDRAPELIDEAEQLYERLLEIEQLPPLETVLGQLGQLGTALIQLPLGFASGLVHLVLLLFISLYTLVEAPAMRRFVRSLFPPGRRERVDRVSHEMAQAMGGFVRGAAITAFLVGLITYLGLAIIGVQYPLVLGLFAGVMEFLPYVGPIIAGVPMLIIALLESPTQALIVLAFFVILQQLESNVLVPNIMRTQTHISPLMAMVAIVGGASLGGLIGALVAIPLVSALRVFGREVAAPAVRRWTGAQAAQEEAQEEDQDA